MVGFDQRAAGPGAVAARVAVGCMRASFHGRAGCGAGWPGGGLFRGAHERMLGLQGAGLRIGLPGAAETTRHERRLLRATTAAQEDDAWLMEQFLFKLAPDREARPALAHAVTALGASLAIAGHWLAAPRLPGPALRLARLRGMDLRRLAVAWPERRQRREAW